MTEEGRMPDRSYMFWSPRIAYRDGIPIPRATYKCKGSMILTKKGNRNAVKQVVTHRCKLVTDHPRNSCLCICGEEFNERSKSV